MKFVRKKSKYCAKVLSFLSWLYFTSDVLKWFWISISQGFLKVFYIWVYSTLAAVSLIFSPILLPNLFQMTVFLIVQLLNTGSFMEKQKPAACHSIWNSCP